MKKGLLIHSYNCNESNWLHTVWGYPPDKPGRLVTAAKVMLEESIDIALICGTAGEKEGKKECWWMRDYLYQHLESLKLFTVYQIFQQYTVDMKKILDRILVVREKDASDTAGETEYAGRFFIEAEVEKVILLTSPDHVSRAIRDALSAWQKTYPRLAANLFITASVTLYSERKPEDREIAKMENVVIIEPPFYNSVGILAQQIFKLRNNPEALEELNIVFKKHMSAGEFDSPAILFLTILR